MSDTHRCFLAVTLALVVAGCSRYGRNEDFIPATGSARKAVEAALRSWQEGHPPGPVTGTAAPRVEAVDSRWQSGQKIVSFEILEKIDIGSGSPTFSVRLTPTRGAPQVVRYVVLGADPLTVYREDDFKRLGGGAGM